MTIDVSTPWHKASYDTFLNERLPALLAERLPLLSYAVESTGVYECRVAVTLGAHDDALDVAFDLPQPDERGIFEIGGQRRVVIPTASRPELDQAEIRCVGEQLYDFVAARLGHAPADLPWDVRRWPVRGFPSTRGLPSSWPARKGDLSPCSRLTRPTGFHITPTFVDSWSRRPTT